MFSTISGHGTNVLRHQRNSLSTNCVYCINILVDIPGVALPVSVQSSCFLDDPPGYTASLRRFLKAILTLYREWHNPAPALNRIPHRCVHARFADPSHARFEGPSYRYTRWISMLLTDVDTPFRVMTLHIAGSWLTAILLIVAMSVIADVWLFSPRRL